ncbi:uncharacterized protein K452DRAFT_195769, partial [Aplosporella prunicola CBS 121167]
ANSPASKRALKPSPMSAAPSQLTVSGDPTTGLSGLHQPTAQQHQPVDPFGAYTHVPQSTTASTAPAVQPQVPSPTNPRKRRASGQHLAPNTGYGDPAAAAAPVGLAAPENESPTQLQLQLQPPQKKGRTNTPWTAAEEQRLKIMRDAGNSWSEIAKTFPTRTEGSVKKHWYKDMHYAEFAEDESAALLAAIKEYEASKWKVIGAKVGKPAKACEQYAKEHFGGR